MSRFNVAKAPSEPDVANRAGGEAFEQSPKLALASLLFTSFVAEQYYRSAEEQLEGIAQRVQALSDKRFAAKAALAARVNYHMRTTSHIVAGEIARHVKGEQWTKHFFNRIVVRPDDMLEIVGYYKAVEGGGLPAAMRKGFNRALRSMDEYELAKYKRERHDWSLHDVINLTRPEPTEAINKLMEGELGPAETWETRKTQAGQSEEESDTEVWADLLAEEKLGYFALLRNLRNIAQEAPDALDVALTQLVDEDRIKGSKVLPFRFQAAMDAILETTVPRRSEIVQALSEALDIAVDNVPKFGGDVLVAFDDSGSMHRSTVSENSDTTVADIGSLFAGILAKASDADIMQFSSDARYANVNPADSTLTIARLIRQDSRGCTTNFESVFYTAEKAYDYIVILSDMQGWDHRRRPVDEWDSYRDRFGCDPLLFSFDLAGYGDMQFPEERVACLAGFSEQVFDVMKTVEAGPQALLRDIESFDL